MTSNAPYDLADPPIEGTNFAPHPDNAASYPPYAEDAPVTSGVGGGKTNTVTHPPNAVEMISHNGTASMEGSCSHYVNPTDEFIDYTISEPYRYFLLVVGSCGCLLASFCYTFALFTRPMVMAAHMNMSDISSVATVMLVFSYFTLPYAFVFDHFGPKPVLIIGTVLLPLGCLLMALTFNGTIAASTVKFSVFLGIMGGGCIVFDIGTVVAVLSWFPTYRGPVVAVMKTFAGLGTAIVATIQHAFFEENPSGFFFFLMIVALVLGVFTILSMQLPPYHLTGLQEKRLNDDQKTAHHRTKQLFLEQAPPRRRMIIGLAFVCLLIVYLPTQSAALAYADNVSHGTKVALAVVVIVILALYPVICLPLPILGGMEPGHTLTIPDLESKLNNSMFGTGPNSFAEQDQHQHVTIAGEEMELADEVEMEHDLDFIAPQFQTTFVQSLCTLHLWAIFAACFAIIGAQLVVIFHYPFICAALRGKETDESFKTLLAALSGVGSALGRLILAWYENYSQHRPANQRTPITVVLFVPGVTSLLGLVLYLVIPGDGIAAAHFIMSIGNGSAAAAAVLVFRGIFAKEPAKHYNFGFLAAMVSAIVLNRVVYGEWYQHEVDKPGTVKSPYTGTCLQKSCVLMPLALMAGLNALAFAAIAYTHIAYLYFCRSVVKQRDEHLAEKAERRERRRRAAEEANAAEVVNDSILGALAEKREGVVPKQAELACDADGSEDSGSCFAANGATAGHAVTDERPNDTNSSNN